MLDFVIFAITFVVFLILLVFYLYPGSRKQTTIPGLDPSDAKDGNISDILQAGSFPEFLINLHEQYGDIASFWMGTQLVVSIGSPKLLEEQSHIFDKPVELYTLYQPLVGENSILYLNGAEGRKKRQIWDNFFNPSQCDNLAPQLHKLIKELVGKWASLPDDQHVPIYQYMAALTMKVSTQLAFGDFIQDKSILEFNKNFEICWTELEARVAGQIPEPNNPREIRLKEAVTELQKFVSNAIKFVKINQTKSSDTFITSMIDAGLSENELIDNALTFVVKFYSMASALTWALYFISSHEDVQEKLYKELIKKDEQISIENLKKMKFLQSVIDESLRVSAIEPWTARYQDLDVEIGKHIIPKKTPVIQALQVVQQNEQNWSLSKNFDPERFLSNTPEINTFNPYGFAGKRHCPAKSLANFHMAIFLKEICSLFKLNFVKGQVVIPKYRICTRTEDEVWLTLKKRS